jgi:hypothetical protein
MSARTVIQNSDDEASDVELEDHAPGKVSAFILHGIASDYPPTVGDFRSTEPLVADDGEGGAHNGGWDLPPKLQQQFDQHQLDQHQPNMMFSEGSSTIPDTTWTQRKALGLERAPVLQSPVPVNGQESQISKSSFNWSEVDKSQGVSTAFEQIIYVQKVSI